MLVGRAQFRLLRYTLANLIDLIDWKSIEMNFKGQNNELVSLSNGNGPVSSLLEDVRCHNFTMGQPHRQEFTSPGYPNNYPAKVDCFLVIQGSFSLAKSKTPVEY